MEKNTERLNTDINPTIFINGELSGPDVIHRTKHLDQLEGVFKDKDAFNQMNGKEIVYEVDAFQPIEEGTEGGLFFGLTYLYPGTVGNEYFMTQGHYHKKGNRSEYYWGIEGEGILLLMDKKGKTWSENISPGSLHYIPGFTAHRVINTGSKILHFGACWPSDAGYNYDAIKTEGFGIQVKKINNKPVLIQK